MLSTVIAALLAPASPSVAVSTRSLDKGPVRLCRTFITGISRSSDVYVCRTKAQWARWDSCSGATRYCDPATKAAIRGYAAFPLNEGSRVICRMLRATGSRLSEQRMCLPQREWQRMWDDSRQEMRVLQDKHSTRPKDFDR